MTEMRILGDRLLLGLIKPSLKTESGLHLLEGFQDDRQQWIVVQTGTQYKGDLKAGDRIICSGYLGNQYDLEDGRIIIGAAAIKNDVIAVWNKESPASSATAPEKSLPESTPITAPS